MNKIRLQIECIFKAFLHPHWKLALGLRGSEFGDPDERPTDARENAGREYLRRVPVWKQFPSETDAKDTETCFSLSHKPSTVAGFTTLD